MTDQDLTPKAVERLVTRYECFDAEPDQEGEWVDYEDYAALAAALAEMTRRRDRWKAIAEGQDFSRVYLDTCAERDAHKARAEALAAENARITEMLSVQTDRLNIALARIDLQAINAEADAHDLAEITRLKAENARLRAALRDMERGE